MVIRQALALTATGLVIGVVVSLFMTDLVTGFLFGVTALDARTRVFVALALVATTLVASLSPARRASRVDPAVALRGD